MQVEKTGNNIVQKIDYTSLANQFVEFFYKTWMTDPTQFVPSGIFTDYSRINIDGNIFVGINIVHKIIEMYSGGGIHFNIKKVNSMDSGSRRIDINVGGTIVKDNITYSFSQYFLIAHFNNSWKFHNSILNIFI